MSIYIYLSISTSISISIYVYIYIYICRVRTAPTLVCSNRVLFEVSGPPARRSGAESSTPHIGSDSNATSTAWCESTSLCTSASGS